MSADVIREAALYLEYFLKGMSECNVIGSYTVQFLEMRGLNEKVNTSLAANLLQLIENMKNLLIKLDNSVLPVCDAKVQTDLLPCSFCQCHTMLPEPLDSLSLPEKRKQLESQENAAEFSHFLDTTGPLIQLKQELPCVLDSATPCSSQCDSVEMEVSDATLKELETKDVPKIKENRIGPETQLEKCVLPGTLRATLGENLDIEREEGEHGEILLDHLGPADSGQSDGLMYSVYTMNSCGALQLVSRVLSKSAISKDTLEEPVERAMIEIKDESGCEPHFIQDQNGAVQIATSHQEEMVVAPDIPVFEGKPVLKISGKCTSISSPKILQAKNVSHSPAASTILTDIVKMGPEDLNGTTWCGICEKEFPSAGSLKAHLSRIHSQVKWCHTCTKTISSEEEMCDHVRECHADLTFVCAICGQSLRTNAAFQRHMDIHKGYRGSACEICGQTFSRTEYCREHKRIHTGEKPYKCETCEKTFSRSSNLYAHMRIHNAESQRHTCNICLKSFARADKLKDHMIRHLQIKRYACRLCPKAYNEKRDLTKHLEKMHSGHNDNDT